MGIDFIYPEYEVARDLARCTRCGVCMAQCSNGVHIRREGNGALLSDNTKCVNCQRCVAFCPTRALKIVKSGCIPGAMRPLRSSSKLCQAAFSVMQAKASTRLNASSGR